MINLFKMSLQIHNIKFPQVYLWTFWCANKRSPFLQKRIFGFFFFFKIMLESWGCGLYTSAAYTRVFTVYIIIYNLHGLSCQEKVSRFSMLLIPRNGTSLAVSHWKLRMVLMVEYRSSRLNQNKPFSGPVSTLLSSSAELYSLSLSGRLRAVGRIALTICHNSLYQSTPDNSNPR